MSLDNIKRIKELTELINKYNKSYYEDNISLVSDYEFDNLLNQLIKLEEQTPEYDNSFSPTKRVGGSVSTGFEKIMHKRSMLSLGDVFSYEELLNFDYSIRKATGKQEIEYVVELKIDGLAMSIEYVEGKISYAATRGDGVIGEVVTENVKTIKTVPLTITETNTIEVRGEVYIKKSVLEKINNLRRENGETLLSNPRNTAAGSIRQLDSKIAASRKLDMFCYYLVNYQDFNLVKHSECLEKLKELGYHVNREYRIVKGIDEVWKFISDYQSKRDSLDYDIDGVVVKVNDLRLYDIIGYTSKTPKWAIAYKFPPEQKLTIIQEINCYVGRSGKITPVASFNKVKLMGSVISKATLHNQDFIKDLGINVGSEIYVQKAGDIIPEVVKAIKPTKNYYKLPEVCPDCQSKLVNINETVDLFCTNEKCPSRLEAKLVHFCSRDAMNIEGLGENIIKQLYKEQLITDIASIYMLEDDYIFLVNLEGFNTKSTDNLLNAIEKSKKQSLEKLLFGLGIDNLGSKGAMVVARNFKTLDNVMNATIDQLKEINDIGEIIANSIYSYFRKAENIQLIQKIKELGLNTKYLGEIKTNPIFTNKKVVITGTLNKYSRNELTKILEDFGAKVSSSVSKNTDFLILGDNPGSKLEEANKYGIKIILEDELITLLDN